MTTGKKAGAKAAPARPRAASGAAAPAAGYSDALLAETMQQMSGAPTLRAVHQLNRRRRAELTHLLGDILPRSARLEKAIAESSSGVTIQDADVMDLLADVEDLLAMLAVDSDNFAMWATEATDVQLLALFAQFAGSFQSGEANSSST